MASMIVPALFLCQVFIPAIYKNSTDIQLAESISPLGSSELSQPSFLAWYGVLWDIPLLLV